MRFGTRLFAALVVVLVVPLLLGLLVSDADLAAELVVAAAAVPAGVAIAAILARLIARPLRRSVESLERLAPGSSGAIDEMERLGDALVTIVERLRTHEEQLDRARDEIQGSVRRLGEVLRATHDLTALLSVVLETALAAVEGLGGAVFLFQATRTELMAKVARQLAPAIATQHLPVGHGLAGWVAQHGRPMLLPSFEHGIPALADPEPREPTALAVPIGDETHVLGVLAIYGHRRGATFREQDLETITSLARQAAVGIENVQLHEQAQRLSITDGLTSIWNHRYFRMRLSQEFAAAKRFTQPLSILWLDIDDFKLANDRFGHQRGDAILIELASRVSGEIREVDTLARYGGEEFILLLPHIDAEGAKIAGERIRRVIADPPFGSGEEVPIPVTVSVGCATFPGDGDTQDSLLDAADKAMYAAKARGKNRVECAGELTDGAGFTSGETGP